MAMGPGEVTTQAPKGEKLCGFHGIFTIILWYLMGFYHHVQGFFHGIFPHIILWDLWDCTKKFNDVIWLVVWTPLKNISQLGWIFPIYGKINNVPNHQPVIVSLNGMSLMGIKKMGFHTPAIKHGNGTSPYFYGKIINHGWCSHVWLPEGRQQDPGPLEGVRGVCLVKLAVAD